MDHEYMYEQEIDLKDLLFTLLYRWRPILLAAVALGLVLGSYKVVKGLQSQQDASLVVETREQYEQDKINYEEGLASYEKNIESIQKAVKDLDRYMEESVLLKIDPYDKPVASADLLFQVEAGRGRAEGTGADADPADSLVKLYGSSLLQRMDWKGLEDELGIGQIYLRELLSVSGDVDSNTLTVTATSLDAGTAENILDAFLANVETCQKALVPIAGDHTVDVVDHGVDTVLDMALVDLKKNTSDKILSYQSSLTNMEKAKDSLVEPELPEGLSRRKVALSGIKYALIGGVGGAFLVAFYFCMVYVLCGKLHTDEELKDQFRVKILGVFGMPERTGAFNCVDRLIERLEGRSVRPPEDEVLDRIALNIINHAKEARKVLLTGTVPEETLKELADKLAGRLPQISLSVGADMNKTADTLRLLAACDAVVLAEQRGTSKCREILQEKEAVDTLKKPILGCIAL